MRDKKSFFSDSVIVQKSDDTVLYNPESGVMVKLCPKTSEAIVRYTEVRDTHGSSDKHHNLINETNLYAYLQEKGFIYNGQSSSLGRSAYLDLKQAGLLPGIKKTRVSITNLCLFPSNICNLNCIYCYGQNNNSKTALMKWETARKAIDWFFSQLDAAAESVGLGFHGAGEPAMNEQLILQSIDYFKSRCSEQDLFSSCSLISNGTKTLDFYDRCIEQDVRIKFSFDGLEEIQNRQRPYKHPLAGSIGSFATVEKTLRHHKEKTGALSVRATVTSQSCPDLEKITRYLIELGTDSIHYEPVMRVGGGEDRYNELAVDFDEFSSAFYRSFLVGFNHHVKVSTSKLMLSASHGVRFCSALGRLACITPDGIVTACVEVTADKYNLSNPFIFGFLDEDGTITIDEDRYQYLSERYVNTIESCAGCEWRYYCSGYCPMEVYRGTCDIYKPDPQTCSQIKSFNMNLVRFLLDNHQSLNKNRATVKKFFYKNEEMIALEPFCDNNGVHTTDTKT